MTDGRVTTSYSLQKSTADILAKISAEKVVTRGTIIRMAVEKLLATPFCAKTDFFPWYQKTYLGAERVTTAVVLPRNMRKAINTLSLSLGEISKSAIIEYALEVTKYGGWLN